MPKPGEIRYCPELGGREANAAFVWIPPGSFWMGDKRQRNNPVHFVTITKGFWIQQTPLTERQYSNKNSDLPETDIYFNAVINFCKGKPLRMPTEAEWEYAARSNTGHKYEFSGSNAANHVSWSRFNSNSKERVGQLKANGYGLFDTSGNVWEMCSDWDEAASHSPQVDPAKPASGVSNVLIRGGSWNSWQYSLVARSNSDSVSRGHYGARFIWEPKHA